MSIVILIVVVLIVLAIIAWFVYLNRPAYLGYRRDRFLGVDWKWDWKNKQIIALEGFCPKCESKLVYDDESCHSGQKMSEKVTFFICPKCEQVGKLVGGNRHYVQTIVKHELVKRANQYVKPKE